MDHKDKILINREYLQLTVYLVYILWNMTGQDKIGIKISNRYANDLTKISMDILMNLNMNRSCLDNSNIDV